MDKGTRKMMGVGSYVEEEEMARKRLGFELLKSMAAAQRLLVPFCPNLTGSFGRSRPASGLGILGLNPSKVAVGLGQLKCVVSLEMYWGQRSSTFPSSQTTQVARTRLWKRLWNLPGQPSLSCGPGTERRQVWWFVFNDNLTGFRIG